MIQNNDTISRQAAIKEVDEHLAYILQAYSKRYGTHESEFVDGYKKAHEHIKEVLSIKVPSVQPDVNEYRKRGEWDMFELITTAWYGKQCYFKKDNGMAYSRKSHKTMTVHDAILEFIREIGDE